MEESAGTRPKGVTFAQTVSLIEWFRSLREEQMSDRLEQAVSAVLAASAEYFAAKPRSIEINHAGAEDVGVVIRVFEDDTPNVFAFKWPAAPRPGAGRSRAERRPAGDGA